MKISKEKIISQYDIFKNTAKKYLKADDIETSVKYIELCARIGYKYNFRYADDELENYIQQISKLISIEKLNFENEQNKIVFYDSFANNRVLTQQYLRAIISWGSDILYITQQQTINEDILDELSKYQKATILQISNLDTFKTKILNTVKTINTFKPTYAFLQFTPWDIIGICLWNLVDNVERYLINLTDHAYWIGKGCSDYFLEFRKYGCVISSKYRNIPIGKLLLQPYYPIQNRIEFQGFPVEKGSNYFAFTGAHFNKLYGAGGLFLKLIKSILENNKNVILLLAGSGNDKPIKAFIKKYNLNNKLIILGDRKDIDQVMKHIDIYINSYPMMGGLMSQLAAVNNIPIVGYTDEALFSYNDVEDFLQSKSRGLLVKTTVADFLSYFSQLIINDKERERNINATKKCVISPEQFNILLLKNIQTKNHINKDLINGVIIDINSVRDVYIDAEKNFIKDHYRILWNTLRWQIIKDHFVLGIWVVYNIIISRLIKLVKKTNRKKNIQSNVVATGNPAKNVKQLI